MEPDSGPGYRLCQRFAGEHPTLTAAEYRPPEKFLSIIMDENGHKIGPGNYYYYYQG